MVIVPLQKCSLLGLPITDSGSTEQTLALVRERLACHRSCIASFINPSAFHLRLVDQAYANALWHFDLILADGIGVVLAARWLNQLPIRRQSFDETSLFSPIMHDLDASKKSLCIVGAKPGVAARAQEKMKRAYPNINYLGVIDGYQPFDETIAWTLSRNPDMVLVGMGAPLQESFLLRLRQEGFDGIGFTCGGFLDQYSIGTQYYPTWIDRLELRWLYRLIMEPGRLWRRYFLEYQPFMSDVLSVLAIRALKGQKLDMHLWLAGKYAKSEGR